jgi:hypothetical protein
MGIYEPLTQFAGKPVVDWDPAAGIQDPEGTIYRVRLSYEEAEKGASWATDRSSESSGEDGQGRGWIDRIASLLTPQRSRRPAGRRPGVQWTDKFALFLADPAAVRVPGIVVGAWHPAFEGEGDSGPVVAALAAARERLPQLRAIFLGDIISEECEISWIQQSDVSPLFDAYPGLEQFSVRGSEGLRLGALRHARLKSLVVQCGGLPAAVVREVCAAELPALEHLELWLGSEHYGADTTVADLAPILSGELFPRLRYLGLRDTEHADEIAAEVAASPVIERIRVLDLSLGTLGDLGAVALLQSPAIARLEKLDLHHHYCSEAMVERLKGLGITVDAGDRQKPDGDDKDDRYVAVSE